MLSPGEETDAANLASCKEIVEEGVFDFESFCNSIKKCVSADGSEHDVDLESYLMAYEQLYNFFVILGGAFQFVAIDVRNKINILKEFQTEEKKASGLVNFCSVKTMVNHEKGSNCFANSKYVSGSRTLLRLHRGLDFIKKFLKEIYELQDSVKLGGVARKVYDETLADHHTWVVRKTARFAMQFLPTRLELLNKISQNNEEKLNYMLEMLPEALKIMNLSYDIVQTIFSDNGLLNLP